TLHAAKRLERCQHCRNSLFIVGRQVEFSEVKKTTICVSLPTKFGRLTNCAAYNQHQTHRPGKPHGSFQMVHWDFITRNQQGFISLREKCVFEKGSEHRTPF